MAEFSGGHEDDYEALAPNHKLWVHLSAGALAGMAEHVMMFPVDSVKTRIQSLCPCPETKCPTPIHGVASMMKREGWLKPLRGVNAVAAGAMPAHALYFTTYEKLKNFLTGNTYGYSNTISYGLAGLCATVIHDLIMNPAEVVKQRMQMLYSPYGGSLECARCIYRTEGFGAFYRSYTTQLVSNLPYQAVHFMTYEWFQQLLNPEHKYDPKSHIIAGGIAGGIGAAVAIPFDCVKTVLNTQLAGVVSDKTVVVQGRYKGISDAISMIYTQRGLRGFTYGIQARVMFQMPGAAISWSVYETFKYMLSDR